MQGSESKRMFSGAMEEAGSPIKSEDLGWNPDSHTFLPPSGFQFPH